jgi:hypothetical protein
VARGGRGGGDQGRGERNWGGESDTRRERERERERRRRLVVVVVLSHGGFRAIVTVTHIDWLLLDETTVETAWKMNCCWVKMWNQTKSNQISLPILLVLVCAAALI